MAAPPPAMTGLDALAPALSGAGVVLLAVVAALALRDARSAPQARLLALLTLSVAALELATGLLSPLLAEAPRLALRSAGVFNLALLWLFSLSLLRDGFRPTRLEWAGAALLTVGPGLAAFGPVVEGPAGRGLAIWAAAAPFVLIAHVVWTAASGRRDDLVEGRRRGRVAAPLVLMVLAAVSVLSEELADPLASVVRNGLALAPAALMLLFWLTRLDPGRLWHPPVVAPPEGPRVDPRDAALYAELVRLMAVERLYREEGLGLDDLARRLGTPPHRLRALINGGLGFRNFSAFVNGYRLEHARAALGDPARGRETVLAIAYESGFGALQTFNRVFRDAEGVTPSAYRARVLGLPDPERKTAAG